MNKQNEVNIQSISPNEISIQTLEMYSFYLLEIDFMLNQDPNKIFTTSIITNELIQNNNFIRQNIHLFNEHFNLQYIQYILQTAFERMYFKYGKSEKILQWNEICYKNIFLFLYPDYFWYKTLISGNELQEHGTQNQHIKQYLTYSEDNILISNSELLKLNYYDFNQQFDIQALKKNSVINEFYPLFAISELGDLEIILSIKAFLSHYINPFNTNKLSYYQKFRNKTKNLDNNKQSNNNIGNNPTVEDQISQQLIESQNSKISQNYSQSSNQIMSKNPQQNNDQNKQQNQDSQNRDMLNPIEISEYLGQNCAFTHYYYTITVKFLILMFCFQIIFLCFDYSFHENSFYKRLINFLYTFAIQIIFLSYILYFRRRQNELNAILGNKSEDNHQINDHEENIQKPVKQNCQQLTIKIIIFLFLITLKTLTSYFILAELKRSIIFVDRFYEIYFWCGDFVDFFLSKVFIIAFLYFIPEELSDNKINSRFRMIIPFTVLCEFNQQFQTIFVQSQMTKSCITGCQNQLRQIHLNYLINIAIYFSIEQLWFLIKVQFIQKVQKKFIDQKIKNTDKLKDFLKKKQELRVVWLKGIFILYILKYFYYQQQIKLITFTVYYYAFDITFVQLYFSPDSYIPSFSYHQFNILIQKFQRKFIDPQVRLPVEIQLSNILDSDCQWMCCINQIKVTIMLIFFFGFSQIYFIESIFSLIILVFSHRSFIKNLIYCTRMHFRQKFSIDGIYESNYVILFIYLFGTILNMGQLVFINRSLDSNSSLLFIYLVVIIQIIRILTDNLFSSTSTATLDSLRDNNNIVFKIEKKTII